MFKQKLKRTYLIYKKRYEALKISIIYFVIGICWILFSDNAVYKLSSNKSVFTIINTYKGIVYVLVSAIIIYLLIVNLRKRRQLIKNELIKTYEDLSTTHDELRLRNENLDMMGKKLIESERRLKKSQAIGDIGNWEIDLSTNIVWGSEQGLSLYRIESKYGFITLENIQSVVK